MLNVSAMTEEKARELILFMGSAPVDKKLVSDWTKIDNQRKFKFVRIPLAGPRDPTFFSLTDSQTESHGVDR
jgi:hypothetical protein